MKKSFLILMFVFSAFYSFAQHADKSYRDEVQLGYGFFTAPQIVNSIGDNFIIPALSLGFNRNRSHINSNGVVTASYLHHTRNRVSFGGEIVYDAFTKTVYDYESGIKSDDIKNRFTSILGRYDYNYIDNENVRMYSGVSLGISFLKQQSRTNPDITGNKVMFAGNLCPFGIAFGSKKIRCYFETGFGFKPSLAAGLCYRF